MPTQLSVANMSKLIDSIKRIYTCHDVTADCIFRWACSNISQNPEKFIVLSLGAIFATDSTAPSRNYYLLFYLFFYLFYCCIFVIIFYFYIQPLKSHFPCQPFNKKGDYAGHKSKICSQVSFVYAATASRRACPTAEKNPRGNTASVRVLRRAGDSFRVYPGLRPQWLDLAPVTPPPVRKGG